ncbi:MAG: RagB/SusD family nutrient uptake outer membrane protein [Candidatus Cryptobacteroides sp.]
MKHIYKFLIALGVALMSASCMNLEPKDQMPDSYVWSSASNFALFANQFYGWTRDFQGSTSLNSMNAISDGPHSDFRSDLLVGTGENVYNKGTNVIPTSDPNYSEMYKRLYYVNLLLKKAESFSDADAIKVPVGEAHFFRAYLYFELVQIFGDAILVVEPIDFDSEQLYGARNDRKEVIALCVSDLKKAMDLLPETPAEDGRLCRYTAAAFLSRVALYEGTWQKYHKNNASLSKELLSEAVEAAKIVMDSQKYELFYSDALGGRDSYRYMFILEAVKCNPAGLTRADNKEYILAKRHDEALKPIGLNITHGIGSATFPTRKLANMYRCQDGLPIDKSAMFQGYSGLTSEFNNRDNRMNATLMKHGQKYWNNDGKWRTAWDETDEENALECNVFSNTGYACWKWATEREVQDAYESYDYPVIRYAEVLLNYAEALYELNESISDEQLNESLNLVRGRSNPTMVKLSNVLVSANGLDMLEEIRAERTVELFHEGFRIDDLKRWKTAETEMPGNRLGILWSGTQFETSWAKQSNPLDEEGCIVKYDGCTWAQKNYLYPLPSNETQLNPQLGQNEGWK